MFSMDHAAAVGKFVRPHRLNGADWCKGMGCPPLTNDWVSNGEGNHMIIIVHHPPSW